MPSFFPFGDRNTKASTNLPAQERIYDGNESDSSGDRVELLSFPFLPPDNLGTNISCIIFSCLSHYIYGIFFNAYESVNSRYDYPNVGSMSFVIATSIILVHFDLSLKTLPIENRTWKFSLYKVLAVTFITHLVLAGIWQQLVNLTWEMFFILKEGLDFLNNYSDAGILHAVSSRMTTKVVNVLTYLEGLAILAFVLLSRG